MGLFGLYKPKDYKYRPIYYDPKKEALKAREKKRKDDEQLDEKGEFRPSIRRGTFREMANSNVKSRNQTARQSNFRLLIILAVLLAIAYVLLFY